MVMKRRRRRPKSRAHLMVSTAPQHTIIVAQWYHTHAPSQTNKRRCVLIKSNWWALSLLRRARERRRKEGEKKGEKRKKPSCHCCLLPCAARVRCTRRAYTAVAPRGFPQDRQRRMLHRLRNDRGRDGPASSRRHSLKVISRYSSRSASHATRLIICSPSSLF